MILALVMAIALGSETPLTDASQEARAQGLMREIRCVVCENEPVSQSTADIAVDMRRVIRQQVETGASNDEVRTYFADRYGQFVLFRPPASGLGVLVWVFPFALLLGAGALIFLRARSAKRAKLAPLAEDFSDDGAA